MRNTNVHEWVGFGVWSGWRITTDHPASSHGQPVLVSPVGEAFGPGDIQKDWTAAVASEHWGLSPSHVRNLCAAGEIPGAYKRGKVWYIPPGTLAPNTGGKHR